MVMELLAVLGGLLLWWINPPMGQDEDQRGERVPLRTWMSPSVIAILAAAGAAVLVLSGTDLSIVAAVRSMQVPTLLGLMMAVWGAGSAIGGLVYGATTRHPPLMILLGLLGATTALVALAPGVISFGVLTFLCGAFCAPTMTAGLDALTREVPVAVRGEAMGWHSSLATAGASLGAPLVGLAIDGTGWQGGFVSAGVVGMVIAAVGFWIAPRTGAEHLEGLLSAEEIEARALGQA
jgi:sugar phosphate permease